MGGFSCCFFQPLGELHHRSKTIPSVSLEALSLNVILARSHGRTRWPTIRNQSPAADGKWIKKPGLDLHTEPRRNEDFPTTAREWYALSRNYQSSIWWPSILSFVRIGLIRYIATKSCRQTDPFEPCKDYANTFKGITDIVWRGSHERPGHCGTN